MNEITQLWLRCTYDQHFKCLGSPNRRFSAILVVLEEVVVEDLAKLLLIRKRNDITDRSKIK